MQDEHSFATGANNMHMRGSASKPFIAETQAVGNKEICPPPPIYLGVSLVLNASYTHPMPTPAIRRLTTSDAEDYRTIRLSALKSSPEAFSAVYAIEASKPRDQHADRLSVSLVFGAYDDTQIIGVIGLKPEDGPKNAHKGFLWGFYVEPAHRKSGAGTALVAAALQAAQGVLEQVTLTVVAENTAAIALYETFGFKRYGVEPRAMKTPSGYADEVLMVLFLD